MQRFCSIEAIPAVLSLPSDLTLQSVAKAESLRIADVRTAVVKGGGKMADSGSVLFNFQRRGEIYVQGSASTEEHVTSTAPLVELQVVSQR